MMAFPNAYSFIENAFQEDGYHRRSLSKGDPLIDDVFQQRMEVVKAQKLK
jgi:hypothetical protein